MPSWLRRLSYALVALVVLGAGFQAWSVLPAAGFDATPVVVPPGTRELVLAIHGSGGREEPVIIALVQALQARLAPGSGTAVVRYIWAPWSDDKLRAHPNGVRVGGQLGAQLAAVAGLEAIHLIAHSAGSYVLDPLCRAYRAGNGRARIRMTYLDPIGFNGPFDPGYGARHYGECADEAEAFINTDDPVPATAAVLRHARTTDVTADPGRAEFGGDGHRWPVQYYLNHLPMPVRPAEQATHATADR
ncbi:MAG: hypothetical protein J0M16_03740 [Gammaproteobacteria bacterium]|nr:hypothetical protein [Gammaproteobacteria bacterium]